jgi:hypothetical protein
MAAGPRCDCRDAGKTRARPLKCLTGDCDAGQALSERCVGGHGRCAVRSTDKVGTKVTGNRDTSSPICASQRREVRNVFWA